MEVKIQHGIGYIEVEINIGKIESDIWPSRHLDDRNVWNNSSDDLPHPVLEIPTLISTHATLDDEDGRIYARQQRPGLVGR